MLRWNCVSLCLMICMGQSAMVAAQQDPNAVVKVFKPGPDIISPSVLPTDFHSGIVDHCPAKLSGSVVLALIVAADGTPKNIQFLHPIGTDLDRLAVEMLARQRFTPGTHDGASVAVSQSVKMKIEACFIKETAADAQEHTMVRLSHLDEQFSPYGGYPKKVLFAGIPSSSAVDPRADAATGTYRVGKGITPPLPISTPEVYFPPGANKSIDETVLVSIVVDANGLPQIPQAVRSSSSQFTAEAVDAATRWRFKPAMKDGEQPVPVRITIQIRFLL